MNNIDELQQLSPSSPVQRERRCLLLNTSEIFSNPIPIGVLIQLRFQHLCNIVPLRFILRVAFHLARYDSMGISSPVGPFLPHASDLYNGMNDNAMHDYAQQASSTHRRGSLSYIQVAIPSQPSCQGHTDMILLGDTVLAKASITAARATRPPETFSQTSGLAIGIDGGSPTSWTPPLSLDISSTLLHPSRGREIFWTPGDDEMENEVSPGSQELSAVVLVGKVFDTSAGQILRRDLEPSLEKQLGNTSGSGRKSNSQADGEASRGGAAPALSLGGVRYGVNGEVLPCTLTSNDVKYGKVLQHWAWQHVTNEASAIRRGIISMDNAQIVDTQEKLDGAVFHLGLCPNPQCWNESQMRLSSNKPGVIGLI
ncbi:hypothetical protein BU17DRAFT_72348 [Hysterangium stoloniferum]|nr:hypothetical protein BU17DRAFT_72348 [Hysterangium stoloniferum]